MCGLECQTMLQSVYRVCFPKVNFLVAKSVVTVSNNQKVPVKLLNPTNDTIVILKGRMVVEFNVLNSEYDCASFSDSLPTEQHAKLCETDTVQNLTDIKMCNTTHTELRCNESNFSKVKSLFKLPDSLEETERDKLIELLHENLDLFVTDDNPELGFTRVVEHKILLKPDVVGKHQKPYRLPPFKREILRDHLNNLLEQGIIAPVSETEDLLISSPIVLVSKRSKNAGKPSAQDFRFCCDYRFLIHKPENLNIQFRICKNSLNLLAKLFRTLYLPLIFLPDSFRWVFLVTLVSIPLSIHVSGLTNFYDFPWASKLR